MVVVTTRNGKSERRDDDDDADEDAISLTSVKSNHGSIYSNGFFF
jgi:hypothetical protein